MSYMHMKLDSLSHMFSTDLCGGNMSEYCPRLQVFNLLLFIQMDIANPFNVTCEPFG